MKYVHTYAQTICDLVHEVGRIAFEVRQAEPASRNAGIRLANLLWAQSEVRCAAEELFGAPISIASRQTSASMTVQRLVDMLMSSTVVLIAGLNARRKDEIAHKTLGLRRDSMRPINEELRVYEGVFYIEKTLKSYAPYFVNQTTFDAFSALKLLERAQLDVEELFFSQVRDDSAMEHSMFWSRSWAPTRATLQSRVWFNFSFDAKGSGRAFTTAALGDGLKLAGGGGHVFRRFYAIIFFYRFEHGGLLALRYQLDHNNCETTKQYVTSAMHDAVEARIPVELRRSPKAVQAAIEGEWRALDEEIAKVGDEKLQARIVELLEGQTFSGGFPRLVDRLHRLFMADLDYSAMDKERQARRLQERLKGRGHALRPLPQADCAAGTSKARGARCASSKGNGPSPENATAEVCGPCAYSWTSKGHVDGLKLDLQVLDRDVALAPLGTPLRRGRETSRDNLRRVIWLHETRINQQRA